MGKEQFHDKSLVERERILWMASERYMRGEITYEELKEIEKPFAREFDQATLGLGRQIATQQILPYYILIPFTTFMLITLMAFFITQNKLILALFCIAIVPFRAAWDRYFPKIARKDNKRDK